MLRAIGLAPDRLRSECCTAALACAVRAGLNAAVWRPGPEFPIRAREYPQLRHYPWLPEPPPSDRLLELRFSCPELAGFIAPGGDPRLRDFAVASGLEHFLPEEFPMFTATRDLPEHWRQAAPGAGIWADRDFERGWLLWHTARLAGCHPQQRPDQWLQLTLREVFALKDHGPASPFRPEWLMPPELSTETEPSHRYRELAEHCRDRSRALFQTGLLFPAATRAWSTLYALQRALLHDLGCLRLTQLQLRRAHGDRIDPAELRELEQILARER